jgi:hypothetical protein
VLRQVDQGELIAEAGRALALPQGGPASDRVLCPDGLSELFGLELAPETEGEAEAAKPRPRKAAKKVAKKAAHKPTKKRAGPATSQAATGKKVRSPKGRKLK